MLTCTVEHSTLSSKPQTESGSIPKIAMLLTSASLSEKGHLLLRAAYFDGPVPLDRILLRSIVQLCVQCVHNNSLMN